jgi:hypothetical protein
MLYKAKIAVCSEILKKTLNAKRTPCRIVECEIWWYIQKPLGFKKLRTAGQQIETQRTVVGQYG